MTECHPKNMQLQDLNPFSSLRKVSGLLTIIETFLFLHIGFGSHNLEAIFRREGYFENEIQKNLNETIKLANSNISQASYDALVNQKLAEKYIPFYSLPTITSAISKVCVSIFLDNYGFWFARSFTIFFSFLGIILVFFTNVNNPYMMYISFPLLYGSNIGSFFSNIFITNLFPSVQGFFYMILRFSAIFENWVYTIAGF